MKHLAFAAVAVMLVTCSRGPAVPVERLLWRLDRPWAAPAVGGGNVRKAPATILGFRPDHEFVELHCWLVERPDESVYIVSSSPHVMIVGRWTQDGSEIRATRQSIARSTPFNGPRDPLCAQGQLTFRVTGNSVEGNAGEPTPGIYSPVTRLVSPDFESYVKDARNSPVTCGPPAR